MSTFPFLEMFFEYQPDEPLREALSQAAVSHAEIDRDNRSVTLTLQMPVYLPAQALAQTAQALCALYGLRSVSILPQFPAEALSALDGQELSRLIVSRFSPAAAILAGCRWELAEGESTLHLRANGKDLLAPHLPAAESYIRDRFGV